MSDAASFFKVIQAHLQEGKDQLVSNFFSVRPK